MATKKITLNELRNLVKQVINEEMKVNELFGFGKQKPAVPPQAQQQQKPAVPPQAQQMQNSEKKAKFGGYYLDVVYQNNKPVKYNLEHEKGKSSTQVIAPNSDLKAVLINAVKSIGIGIADYTVENLLKLLK